MDGLTNGDERFWRFSLALYAREGVPPVCLQLQDRFGVDVNVLLYCLFRAADGHAIAREDLEALDRGIAGWRAEVVAPLRSIRRAMKTAPLLTDPAEQGSLRERIKACELAAERAEQRELERRGADVPVRDTSPAQAALANYEAYGAVLGTVLPGSALAALVPPEPDLSAAPVS